MNYFTTLLRSKTNSSGGEDAYAISPLEWNLIETWKQRGIPAGCPAWNRSTFESRRARPQRARRSTHSSIASRRSSRYTRSISCPRRRERENGHKEKKPKKNAESPFSFEAVRGYLVERHAAIEAFAVDWPKPTAKADRDRCEAMTRASERLMLLVEELQTSTHVDSEGLESELTRLEELILSSLKEGLQPPALEELRREGASQLRRFRQGMDPAIYEQTLDNFVAKGLRDRFQIPRLSLFYL